MILVLYVYEFKTLNLNKLLIQGLKMSKHAWYVVLYMQYVTFQPTWLRLVN